MLVLGAVLGHYNAQYMKYESEFKMAEGNVIFYLTVSLARSNLFWDHTAF